MANDEVVRIRYVGTEDPYLVHAPFHGVEVVDEEGHSHPIVVHPGDVFEAHIDAAHGHDTVFGLKDEHHVVDPGLLARDELELA